MPVDPIHPDQPHGDRQFRADLVAYLDGLPVGELAELLGELPRSRQEPLGLGVLMVALNERLPDAYKLLPPAGHPGPGEGRRRSLLEVVADRRAARTSRHPDTPASGLADWPADRQRRADLHAERARAGAVGERRVAETLRARATDHDPAARRQGPGGPSAERERGQQDQERDRQEREHQREPEDDFTDSWHTYRERAEHLRQIYGWRVPEPPPRAEPWLPLGRTDQEHDGPPDRPRLCRGEERDDRGDR
jgi:hypothetical protein